MTTFESAISRTEADLVQVQSALDAAQHVLETASRVHTAGRNLGKTVFRLIRIGVILLALGGIAVTVVMLVDRFSHRSDRRARDEATDVTPIDRIGDS